MSDEEKPKRTAFIQAVSDAVEEKLSGWFTEIKEMISAEPITPTVSSTETPPTSSEPEKKEETKSEPTKAEEPVEEPAEPVITSQGSAPSERPRRGFNLFR